MAPAEQEICQLELRIQQQIEHTQDTFHQRMDFLHDRLQQLENAKLINLPFITDTDGMDYSLDFEVEMPLHDSFDEAIDLQRQNIQLQTRNQTLALQLRQVTESLEHERYEHNQSTAELEAKVADLEYKLNNNVLPNIQHLPQLAPYLPSLRHLAPPPGHPNPPTTADWTGLFQDTGLGPMSQPYKRTATSSISIFDMPPTGLRMLAFSTTIHLLAQGTVGKPDALYVKSDNCCPDLQHKMIATIASFDAITGSSDEALDWREDHFGQEDRCVYTRLSSKDRPKKSWWGDIRSACAACMKAQRLCIKARWPEPPLMLPLPSAMRKGLYWTQLEYWIETKGMESVKFTNPSMLKPKSTNSALNKEKATPLNDNPKNRASVHNAKKRPAATINPQGMLPAFVYDAPETAKIEIFFDRESSGCVGDVSEAKSLTKTGQTNAPTKTKMSSNGASTNRYTSIDMPAPAIDLAAFVTPQARLAESLPIGDQGYKYTRAVPIKKEPSSQESPTASSYYGS